VHVYTVLHEPTVVVSFPGCLVLAAKAALALALACRVGSVDSSLACCVDRCWSSFRCSPGAGADAECGMQTHRRQTQTRVRGVANTPGRRWKNAFLGPSGQGRRDGGWSYCRTRRERDHSSPQSAVRNPHVARWQLARGQLPSRFDLGRPLIIIITPRAKPLTRPAGTR
jgi:hypothetical protein